MRRPAMMAHRPETAMAERFSLSRVLVVSAGLLAVGALALLLSGRPGGAAALTVSGGVAIINLRWLDGFLERLLQPGRARFGGRTVAVMLLRMGLVLAVVSGLLLYRPEDGVAVGVGFTLPLLVLVFEGVRTTVEGES